MPQGAALGLLQLPVGQHRPVKGGHSPHQQQDLPPLLKGGGQEQHPSQQHAQQLSPAFRSGNAALAGGKSVGFLVAQHGIQGNRDQGQGHPLHHLPHIQQPGAVGVGQQAVGNAFEQQAHLKHLFAPDAVAQAANAPFGCQQGQRHHRKQPGGLQRRKAQFDAIERQQERQRHLRQAGKIADVLKRPLVHPPSLPLPFPCGWRQLSSIVSRGISP